MVILAHFDYDLNWIVKFVLMFNYFKPLPLLLVYFNLHIDGAEAGWVTFKNKILNNVS